MHSIKRGVALAATLTLGFALAACGSSEDAETPEEVAAPAPVLTTAPTPTAAPLQAEIRGLVER